LDRMNNHRKSDLSKDSLKDLQNLVNTTYANQSWQWSTSFKEVSVKTKRPELIKFTSREYINRDFSSWGFAGR
jgi:hypothetical protein